MHSYKFDKTLLFLTLTDQRNNPLNQYPDYGHCNYDLHNNWLPPLKSLFRKVVVFDYLEEFVNKGLYECNSKIIKIIKKLRPDYVICPLYIHEIMEETFDLIRKSGIKVIGYFFDDQACFDTYTIYYLSHLDFIVTVDHPNSVNKYKKYGIKALFQPCVVSSNIYKKLNLESRYDVSFIGSNIVNRSKFIEEIKKNNIQVNTFGKNWSSGFVSQSKMIEIFNSSKINLNFSENYTGNRNPQIKARMFEICLCGGFLLTEYFPGIENLYKIDKEIVVFHTINELLNKIKYYLKHNKERVKIANAGYLRTIKMYTWKQQFIDVFNKIENNKIESNTVRNIMIPRNVNNIRSNYHYSLALQLKKQLTMKLSNEELSQAVKYSHFLNKLLLKIKYAISK